MSDDAPKKTSLTDTAVEKLSSDLADELEARMQAREALRPSRKTVMQHAEEAAGVTSKAPIAAIVVGAVFTGIAGWQLYLHPPTAFNVEALWRIGCLVFGLACFPGVLPLAVKNLRGVVGLWKTFKNGNGSSGPAGG